MATPALLAIVGGLLVFVLPGFAVSKATFPEWRAWGPPEGWVGTVRLAASSLVLSVALTVLVGFGLLNSPGGFQASWSDPMLEVILAAITAVGLAIGLLRGGFSRRRPDPPVPPPAPGDEGAWALLRKLEANRRRQRQLRHLLRVGGGEHPPQALEEELRRLEGEARRLAGEREAEYAR